MARTLVAMASALAVIAVVIPSGAPPEMARGMAVGHGVFAGMFALAGVLFRRASLAGGSESETRQTTAKWLLGREQATMEEIKFTN